MPVTGTNNPSSCEAVVVVGSPNQVQSMAFQALITSETNLDNLKSPGLFYFNSQLHQASDIVYTPLSNPQENLTNLGLDIPGTTLKVFAVHNDNSDGFLFVTQELVSGETNDSYRRQYYSDNGNWTEWEEITSSEGGGAVPRIIQWKSEGYRVYGNSSPKFYGQDTFPAYLNFDFNTGQTDETLISMTYRRVIFQAPYDCKIVNFFSFTNEANTEYAFIKCDQNFNNETVVYHNTQTQSFLNDRGITTGGIISKGDFVGLFIKRPDGSPAYIETSIFVDFEEVIS